MVAYFVVSVDLGIVIIALMGNNHHNIWGEGDVSATIESLQSIYTNNQQIDYHAWIKTLLKTAKIIAKNVLLYSISGLAIESKKPYFKQDSE